jgi:oligoribonuclease (3'-5' exoribonuclease)
MTGLDPENDRIIEVATLVTDPNLNLIAEGPIIAVHQSESMMNSMDDWNQRHHGRSGLIERVKKFKSYREDCGRADHRISTRTYWRKNLADVWKQHLSGSSVLGEIHADA